MIDSLVAKDRDHGPRGFVLMLDEMAWIVKVHDLSATGAKLGCSSPPKANSTTILRVGGQNYACRVAWSKGQFAGIQFTPLLSGDALQAVAAHWPGAVSAGLSHHG